MHLFMVMNKGEIVCIGDSLTEGYGVDKTQCWCDLLAEELGIEIINSGISGDTTGGMLARFHEMVIRHQPGHVIIMGGTNDLWLNLPYNLIIANIMAMTRYARHHGIVPVIGVPTPFFFQSKTQREEDNLFIGEAEHSKRIGEYQKILKNFAQNDGWQCINFGAGFTPDLVLNDGLHPNKQGHILMKENASVMFDIL